MIRRRLISSSSPSYRWVIVATIAVNMFIIYGIRHSFSAFFPPILAEFGWSRGSTAFMFSLNLLLYGLLAPVSGTLIDRWKPKKVIFLGISILTLSTLGSAVAGQLWHFYLLYGVLMSVGTAFAGQPTMIPTITNWFTRRRGFAIGLVYSGGGASFAMPMLTSFAITAVGWRWSFALLAGLLVGIVVPLVAFFFRYRPDKPPVRSSQDNGEPVAIYTSPFGHLELPDLLRNFRLYLVVLAQTAYMGFANYMIVAHQVVYVEDLGYGTVFAGSVAGVAGAVIGLGALGGFITDNIGRERTITISAVLSSASLIILLLQKDMSTPWALYLFAILFGLGMGLMGPSITAGAADLFHGKHFGMVNGLILFGMGFGGLLGTWFGGYIFDMTGSYLIAFIACIVAYIVACASLWIAAPRKAAHLSSSSVRISPIS